MEIDRRRAVPGRARLIGWLPLLFACLLTAPAFGQSPEQDYLIGAKDLIEVQVLEHPDLRQEVRVSERGVINLPLIGEVRVAGLSVESITRRLTEAFSEFIYTPKVQVTIREYHQREVNILGEVQRPGVFQIAGRKTLLEMLTLAGGLRDTRANQATVIRRVPGDAAGQTIVVNIDRLLSGNYPDENIVLEEGDTVYIPQIEQNYFYVFGEVSRPGSFRITKEQRITVLMAISLAGGFTDRAAKGKIKITREEGGRGESMKVDLETLVKPNDIIIVPESFF